MDPVGSAHSQPLVLTRIASKNGAEPQRADSASTDPSTGTGHPLGNLSPLATPEQKGMQPMRDL